MLNDPLADTMSVILNNEIIGKSECTIKPSSKIIRQLLKVMKDNEYLLDFKEVEDSRGNYIHLKLNGNINKCGVIKPRYSVKNNEFEKIERRNGLAARRGSIHIGAISCNQRPERRIQEGAEAA